MCYEVIIRCIWFSSGTCLAKVYFISSYPITNKQKNPSKLGLSFKSEGEILEQRAVSSPGTTGCLGFASLLLSKCCSQTENAGVEGTGEVSAAEAENTRLSSGNGPSLPPRRGLEGEELASWRSTECPVWSLPAAAACLMVGLTLIHPNHQVSEVNFPEARTSLRIL